jgi:restriction system protein
MTRFFRVMLGRGSAHASECFACGFIGTDFGIEQDLSADLPEQWREFNEKFIPVFLALHPDRTRIGAGLACGALWTVSKGIQIGDMVLCPDGAGTYRVGEITGNYYFVPNGVLPHRRKVRWLESVIPRAAMSEALRNSSGSIGTVCDLSAYSEEISRLVGREARPALVAADPSVEDPVAFAMEKHLEAFLVANWSQTELARDFSIYEEDGEPVGQQYATDAGPIDILAVSHDRKRLLVVELKRGRASDVVVGQILRYMGYIKEQVAEPSQTVEGAIIALENDQKLRWALATVPSIKFYRYQVSFRLLQA